MKQDIKKGALYLLAASFLFSSMQAASKALYYISSFERTFYFSAVAAVLFFAVCRYRKEPLRGKRPDLLFLRSLFGFVSTIFLFLSSTKDFPIANVSLLSSTSTIFALVAACVWLKEKMNKGQIAALILAFIGVIAILQPRLTGIEMSAVYGLLGGLLAGMAYTVVRRLKDDATPYTMTFYFMAFSALASLPIVMVQGFTPLHGKEIALLIFMGLCMSFAQLFLSYAYQYAPSTKISVYLYSQNLFAFLIGIIAFHEMPDIISICGGILLIGAGILNFYEVRKEAEYERKNEKSVSGV